MTGTVLGAVGPVVTSLGEVLSQHSPGPSLEALLVGVGKRGVCTWEGEVQSAAPAEPEWKGFLTEGTAFAKAWRPEAQGRIQRLRGEGLS